MEPVSNGILVVRFLLGPMHNKVRQIAGEHWPPRIIQPVQVSGGGIKSGVYERIGDTNTYAYRGYERMDDGLR